jgi:hypothetical protein
MLLILAAPALATTSYSYTILFYKNIIITSYSCQFGATTQQPEREQRNTELTGHDRAMYALHDTICMYVHVHHIYIIHRTIYILFENYWSANTLLTV